MPRFLIEIPHEDRHAACAKALHAIEFRGSHFMTHADFGCDDGVHVGWLIADVPNRQEAWRVVPPEFRNEARIILLRQYTRDQITDMARMLRQAATARGA